ncbi:USG-1 protein [invertebrate metagenome]|uniref:USG-1 protein n=1 Tax=invertebrate metagenome TaxID=1711999 RepID=A0A2H9T7N2_9ZZZZ
MSRRYDIAVCSATSLSAQVLLDTLAEKKFPVGTLYALETGAKKGASVEFQGEDIDVLEPAAFNFADADLTFLPYRSEENRIISEQAVEAGSLVFDASLETVKSESNYITSESCPVDQLQEALSHRQLVFPVTVASALSSLVSALQQHSCLKEIGLTVCQSVSNAGQKGLDSLREQTVSLLNGRPAENTVYHHRIAYNMIPDGDQPVSSDGSSEEEQRIEQELRMGERGNPAVMCIDVLTAPVFYGDSVVFRAKADNDIDLDNLRITLKACDNLTIMPDDGVATVEDAAGEDNFIVARLRHQAGSSRHVGCYVVTDTQRMVTRMMVKTAQRLINDFL